MDEAKLLAEMRQEGRDAVDDALDRLNASVAAMRGGVDRTALVQKDAHNLKGLGAAFGFPGVSLLAHRLEDYMANFGPGELADADGLQCFLDRIAALAEQGIDAGGETVARLVRGLPSRMVSFDPADIEINDVEIMVVSPRGAATRYVLQELAACGYRVSTVAKPWDAIEFALHGRPDLIVVSAILERFEGVDLVCALRAMPGTRDIPVALITSLESGDDRLRDLPADVPVLSKGVRFSDDVADALSRLGII